MMDTWTPGCCSEPAEEMHPLLSRCFLCWDITRGFVNLNSTIPAWEKEITTLNASDAMPTPTRDTTHLILELLIFVLALVGLAGNSTVLWILGCRLHRNIFSVYILNLACADFLFLCCQVFWSSHFVIKFFHPFPIPSPLNNFLLAMTFFPYIADLSILSAISTERCLSVLWPIWYRCYRPRHLSHVVCILIWVLSLLLSILEKNDCRVLFTCGDNKQCQLLDFFIAAWLIFLFLILSGTSLALLFRILCSSQRMPPTRLYVTLLLTVLVFLLCGLPYGINWFILICIKNFPLNSSDHLHLIAVVLSCVNSCANPIIYFFVGSFGQRRQGQTLKQVLQRALQDTVEVSESGGSLPQGILEMLGSSQV